MARTSRATWVERIERWEQSGLTAKQFAAEANVSAKSLSFWKWKLRRADAQSEHARARGPRSSESTKPKFVQLIASTGEHRALPIEVVLPSQLVVRIPFNFDERALQRIVAALRGA